MREIKFRAWDKEGRRMVTDIEAVYRDGSVYHIEVNADIDGEPEQQQALLHKDYAVLMQFTGLKDRNGKEIYEGDIVLREEDNRNIVVEFEFQEIDAFEVMGWNLYSFMENSEADGKRLQSEYEVIGNIYQHPELLANNK